MSDLVETPKTGFLTMRLIYFYIQNFCGRKGRFLFVADLVANLKDRFSHDKTKIRNTKSWNLNLEI